MCSLSNIIWNIPNLVKIIQIDQTLFSGLLQSGLITTQSLEDLQAKFGNDPAKFAYKLLERVDDEGSEASSRLAGLMMSLHNEEAARLLDPSRLRETASDGCFPFITKREAKVKDRDLDVKVIPAKKVMQGEGIYRLRGGRRRGLALIVNNIQFSEPELYETRHGARRDAENMSSLLTQMGFSVTTEENLTRAEMLQSFLDFSTNEKHGDIMLLGEWPAVIQTGTSYLFPQW